jgi:hypothetical protein
LTFTEYRKLTGGRTKIADLLAMPGSANIELDTPLARDHAQAADLT